MKIGKTNSKRLLWAVMAAGLLGLAGCYSDGSPASLSLRPTPNQGIIASDNYDAATRDFTILVVNDQPPSFLRPRMYAANENDTAKRYDPFG
jgi:hypothetical protein